MLMEQNQKSGGSDASIQKYLSSNADKKNDWQFIVSKERKRKRVLLISLVFFILIALSYISLKMGHKSFDENKTKIVIELPENVKSGEEVSVLFEYKNTNEVSINDVSAEIVFPDGFIFESSDVSLRKENNRFILDIGSIAPDSSYKIRVFGKLIGNLNDEKGFSSTIQYKPDNFNSKFKKTSGNSTKIGSVPVVLDIESPEAVKNNSEAEIIFSYKNISDRNFSKAELRITIPDKFSSYSVNSEIVKEEDAPNILIFPKENLAAGAEVSVALKGILAGAAEQVVFLGEVYLLEDNNEFVRYISEERSVKLEQPDIVISSKINDFDEYSAQKNEELRYKIIFENQGSENLRGLVLNSVLDGNFDLSTLKAEKGNVQGNKIVWSALNVPQLGDLKSGEEGEVEFFVKVKDIFTIQSKDDKNFVLSVKTDMNIIGSGAEQKLLYSDLKESKIKAFTPISVKGYYNDDGRIENFGQVPPKVGERTAYTIHWSIKNLFNDVDKVRVKTILPEGVDLTGKYINSRGDVLEGIYFLKDGEIESFDGQNEEKIYYNSGNREVTWFIPSLKANDGILTSTKEVIFQVALSPKNSDVGKPANLLGVTSVYTHDIFTGLDIKNDASSLTTELFDDYSIGREESLVVGADE